MNMKTNLFLMLTLLPILSLYANTIEITSEQQYIDLKKSTTPTVIQCYAHWCPACKKAMPLFDKLAADESNKQITFARIDIDTVPQIKSDLSLIGVPTFAFIQNGKILHSEVGIKNFATFENYMQDLIAKTFTL